MRENLLRFLTFRHLLSTHLLVKSVFFSLYSSAVTSLLVFLVTGSTKYSISALFLDLFLRFFMYLTFEKNWEILHQKV